MLIRLTVILMVFLPMSWTQAPAQAPSESANPPSVQATVPTPSDLAAPPADATKTASGVATKVLQAGTRKGHPANDDLVTIDYSGRTADGKIVMSTPSGGPLTVNISVLLPGMREALLQMETGETRRMWIPEALAYKGAPGKPKGMLVFDVTLLDMPLRAPADVKAPPPEAQHTASGLAYVVLKEGAGTRHPKKVDMVTVNYTGWTTKGAMFDSSFKQGQPLSLYLDRTIAGWTEGLQLMVEGERVRFWIPEKLAYRGRNAPYGTLVFDIELLNIR